MPHLEMPWGYLEMPHLEMPVSRDASISRCCRISRWGLSRYPYPEMVRLEIQYAEILYAEIQYAEIQYTGIQYTGIQYTEIKLSRDAQSQDASRFYNMTTLRLLSSPAARRCLLLYRRAASPAARTREPRPRACAPGCSSHDSNRAQQQRSRVREPIQAG